MKIAMLSWETLHSIAVGGLAVHVTELAAALARRGHQVHVFTRRQSWMSHYDYIDGVHYHRCDFAFHPDFITEMHNLCRAFVEHLWKEEDYAGRFDIIHSHDWLTSMAGKWAKWGRGRRFVFTLHSTEYGRCGNCHYGGNSSRIRHLEGEGAHYSDRIIAVSNHLKWEIVSIYHQWEGKIWVIPNGISVSPFNGFIDPGAVKARYGIGPLDPTFLFCGRLTHQKGPDLLLEAIPWILKFEGRSKFIFAGDGYLRPHLESRSWQLGIRHAVRFIGHRFGSDLHDIFRAVDAVVLPSRNEPFGIAALEGWAAGKPVIATHNGAEFVWHGVNGYKVYPTAESIAWGCCEIMKNFEHSRWMGRNGRRAAEESFSWDSVAELTERCYNSLF
ncbi:glycosyltransferase family 4 protein [Candidatus Methylacidiphilum infernorum]|uniref:Glycosyltransferase family 4 protein n=1 Tax=Candidatus Methylacidiphilum infernorum TaxID=511746 RepID=A0ABX7PVH5_9BACT|nr:glycosyltransferase family 4 protein [Candidatus Methylacidiphilum infernorum]QSR86992.1 glycosyltransferase family 4 protein [Candidatus Methylacidiphilum infernorum]